MLVAIFIVVALLLVAFGGLMAAVDAAIIALSRADVSELAESARARRSLEAIAEDPDAHLSAVSFTRIVTEMTAAVLVTLAFESIFDEWWLSLILAAIIMSAVSFVLVGTSPRSVGLANARTVLRLTAPLVHALRIILGPVVRGLIVIGDRVTPSRVRTSAVGSEEELLSIVDEATELDVLEEDDRALIHSIFEFNETLVREVMVPRTDMVTIEAEATVETAASLFFRTGVSRIPIVGDEADEILGMLYLRDVAKLTFEGSASDGGRPVTDLARPAVFVPESKKADSLLRQMQRESNHLAMVVDEYGGIAGLVTLEDLIEELVGDISDEYDRETPQVEQLAGGAYRVSARLPVDELGELFDLDLDDEDVDSVGGLLAKALGKLPEAGSTVSLKGLRLTAERTEGRRRRISTVIVDRVALAATSAGGRRKKGKVHPS